MSDFFLADRIKETSRVEGVNSISLDGASAGFSSFDDFYASGDVVFYAITDNSKYEVGSGIYEMDASTRVITRNPIRSSDMNSGPWYVDGTSNSGPTDGQNGFFYPLWLNRSAAQSGVGFNDGPYSVVSGVSFDEFPGQTFYHATEHSALGVGSTAGSGSSFNDASQPVSFTPGVKEVYVTYPGKTAVYNAYGIDPTINEPQASGLAVWKNQQILNYTSKLTWDENNERLGISQSSPQFALDIGGVPADSIIRASGYIDGGSGILFSGGQPTYTSATASGGRQLEPFLRNQIGTGADGLIKLSGLVDQFIGLAEQAPGLIFAGPDPSYCGTGNCPPEVPTFRLLTLNDIPLEDLTTSGNFVVQNNAGLDGQSANITPNNYTLGMIAMYAGSGSITYDSGILFDYNNNRLLVGGDASSETPAYTLDARGTVGAQSGYFNHVLFQDGLIRLGENAGTDLGNLSENYYVISLGNNTGFNGSGLFDALLAGRFAGLNSETCSGVVFLGVSAAENSSDADDFVAIGSQAGSSTSSISSFVAIGSGTAASAINAVDSVAIGSNAAASMSGAYNVYIGSQAGFATSGDSNIEITNFASSSLGGNVSNRLAIGGLVAGNTAAGKIAVGSPSGTDPIATLTVEPADANDAAFVVRHQGSGSSSPYIQCQSGDGTTFYQVTSGGDVITSGWMKPSGGLWLPPTPPTRSSGVGSHMLWNDANTLIWNGSAVGGAGSFSSWNVTTQGGSEAISDGQAVTISGVSGIDVTNVGSRNLIFDGGELSGICSDLYNQIIDSEYSFFAVASGDGSNNNDPKSMAKNSVFAVSGVSGIKVDFMDLTDGTNSSGVFKIGYDISNTYSFKVTNGDFAGDFITNTETVTISGVSGVRAEYDQTSNTFRIGASGLSGVFQTGIDSLNTDLGSISGISVWSSGEFGRLGLGSTAGTSGIKLQDSKYIIDPTGVGNLDTLNFQSKRVFIGIDAGPVASVASPSGGVIVGNDGLSVSAVDSGVISIGDKALSGSVGDKSNVVAIGHGSLSGSALSTNCIAFGEHASLNSSGIQNIAIGYLAGQQVSRGDHDSSYDICIGSLAGSQQISGATGVIPNVYIGYNAGKGTTNGSFNVGVGESALRDSINTEYSASFGYLAGTEMDGVDMAVSMGAQAHYQASGLTRSIAIGSDAGRSSASSASDVNTIFIGSNAGQLARNSSNLVCVGANAGLSSSGVDDSIFIGSNAGKGRKGANSIIFSVDGVSPGSYDATWTGSDSVSDILEIGAAIQGRMSPVNIHIGKPLDHLTRTISTITDSALNVTPDSTTDSAVILNLNGTTQAAGLLKTQFKYGSTIQSVLNEIINSDGLLRLPQATSKSGTYPNVVLSTTTGDDIEPGEGVVCMYDFGADRGLAVSLEDAGNYVWYKVPITTAM